VSLSETPSPKRSPRSAGRSISPADSLRAHEGVRHYKLRARRERRARRPRVTGSSAPVPPDRVGLRVTVSAGTYVRALARDLGERLGCGGHLVSLRRTASGPFRVDEAASPASGREALIAAIRPLEAIPLGMPTVEIDEDRCRLVRNGRAIEIAPPGTIATERPDRPERGRWIRLVDSRGRMLALGEIEPAGEGSPAAVVHPRIVFL
jgi:tRNA pseudouridine55 synthase